MRVALPASLLLATLVSCTRPHASPADAGPQTSPAPDAAVAREAPADPPPVPTFREARRVVLAKLDDEPGLAKSADAIRTHFGGTLPASMQLQEVPLGAGKQALFLEAAADDPNPFALLVDSTGAALWTKNRPLAGITPPAGPVALAPRPDNGVALFLYDAPTRLVAARMWTAEGAPFADLVLFQLARCDAVTAAWWPGQGWIVVTSFPGGARAQRLTEEGVPAWDPHGIAVGEAAHTPAPATIAIDRATSTWLLVQHVKGKGAGEDHVVTTRYSVDAVRVGSTTSVTSVMKAGDGAR